MITPHDILSFPGDIALGMFVILILAVGLMIGTMFLGKRLVDWYFRRVGLQSTMNFKDGD